MPTIEVPVSRVTLSDLQEVKRFLGARGIGCDHWHTPIPLAPEATEAEILAAYADWLGPLMSEGGYAKADVLRVTPRLENIDGVRHKFLREHTHAEDEVRFFVEGKGLFWFNPTGDGSDVFVVHCGAGDIVSVPAGMRHWFDMGASPRYTAIRVFTSPAGWTPVYTDSGLEAHFNRPYHQVL